MRRFVIFLALGPALIASLLMTVIFPLESMLHGRGFRFYWFTPADIGNIYFISTIPAFFISIVDIFAADRPYRIAVAALCGLIMSALFTWSGFAHSYPGWWRIMPAVLIGAIPAAVCSWLAGRLEP
jgi:hypothetical protein